MAPSRASLMVQPIVTKNADVPRGKALEDLSDAIEDFHVREDQAKKFGDDKDKSQFRQYETSNERVMGFYKEQHNKQTYEYNVRIREQFKDRNNAYMGIWEAMEKLNEFIDNSDPDTDLSQIQHLLQSAEAVRRDCRPRWFQVAALIHDLGKLLHFFGCKNQWEIVGDTFPVGCAFDDTIILRSSTFENNPDTKHPVYSTKLGIYQAGCGLDNIILAWGHDEYLYHVVKNQSSLPDEALAMIRYHSFYPWHNKGAYTEFMNEHDYKMLEAVKAFNPYDLYSKSDEAPNIEKLKVSRSFIYPLWRGFLK